MKQNAASINHFCVVSIETDMKRSVFDGPIEKKFEFNTPMSANKIRITPNHTHSSPAVKRLSLKTVRKDISMKNTSFIYSV